MHVEAGDLKGLDNGVSENINRGTVSASHGDVVTVRDLNGDLCQVWEGPPTDRDSLRREPRPPDDLAVEPLHQPENQIPVHGQHVEAREDRGGASSGAEEGKASPSAAASSRVTLRRQQYSDNSEGIPH